MNEKTKLTAELKQAAEAKTGKPLTKKEQEEVEKFSESFLLLLDDTEE